MPVVKEGDDPQYCNERDSLILGHTELPIQCELRENHGGANHATKLSVNSILYWRK